MQSQKKNFGARVNTVHREIDRLEAKLLEIQALRVKTVSTSVAAFRRVFTPKTDEVAQTWLSSFMDMIRGKTANLTKLGETADIDRQYLDDAEKELELKLRTLRGELDSLEKVDDKRTYDMLMERSGYRDAERDFLNNQHKKQKLEKDLEAAMIQANLPDAKAAAVVLAKSQETLHLLSTVVTETKEIAEQVRGWKTHFDNLVERLGGKAHVDSIFLLGMLPVIEKSFKVIGDAYDRHMGQITAGENKSEMIHAALAWRLPSEPSSAGSKAGDARAEEL